MRMGRGIVPSSGPTCFFRLPRLFSWWAARAKATVPRAVAKRTFRRPGVNRSCENADCAGEGVVAGHVSLRKGPGTQGQGTMAERVRDTAASPLKGGKVPSPRGWGHWVPDTVRHKAQSSQALCFPP